MAQMPTNDEVVFWDTCSVLEAACQGGMPYSLTIITYKCYLKVLKIDLVIYLLSSSVPRYKCLPLKQHLMLRVDRKKGGLVAHGQLPLQIYFLLLC